MIEDMKAVFKSFYEVISNPLLHSIALQAIGYMGLLVAGTAIVTLIFTLVFGL